MKVELRENYGLLIHNETDEHIAGILSCFMDRDSVLLFSFYERNLNLVDSGIQQFIAEQQEAHLEISFFYYSIRRQRPSVPICLLQLKALAALL